MTLKGYRDERVVNVQHTAQSVCEEGQFFVKGTAGSGTALDTRNQASVSSSSSGTKVVGMALRKVVSIDTTKYHRNFHNGEQLLGEPVPLLEKGFVVTNLVIGTPTAGAPAYLASSGYVQTTLSSTGGLVATPLVGRFETVLDENSYVELTVELP